MVFGVWLGVAGVGLSSAHFFLWRTRRLLHPSRQDSGLRQVSRVPAGATVPSGVSKSARSALAS